MDFTHGFKKLREALPLIDLSGRCYGDENFIPAPYSDPIKDAGYFGGVGIEGYMELPDTPVKKGSRHYGKYDDNFTGDWRKCKIYASFKPHPNNPKYDRFNYRLEAPVAFDLPWESVCDSQSEDVQLSYTKHFYFSYFYLLNYGNKLLKDVQKYLMQDIDKSMDDKKMKRPAAIKEVEKRIRTLDKLYKEEFVKTFVIPYYEKHQNAYDFDMHATEREIYERVINDPECCKDLGIVRDFDKKKILKKFG